MASKGKKKHKQSPPPPPETVVTLPVIPDRWELKPAVFNENGEQLTVEHLVFYLNNQPVMTVEEPETKLQTLLNVFFNRDPEGKLIPDSWTIKTPTSETETDPVMTFTRNGRVLATTVLDQKRLKSISRALNRHIYKPAGISTLMKRWWLKHKVGRVFLVLLFLPLLFGIAYSFVWGLQL